MHRRIGLFICITLFQQSKKFKYPQLNKLHFFRDDFDKACILCIWYTVKCKPTFIRMHEIFARLMRALLSQIFLAGDQMLSYKCMFVILRRVWIRLGPSTLVFTDQFIGSKSRNKVLTNKSWFTASLIIKYKVVLV